MSPDGKPRNNIYLRELAESQLESLENGIRVKGGIDISLPCWQEGDPVYGSLAYEQSGSELHWIERERERSEAW